MIKQYLLNFFLVCLVFAGYSAMAQQSLHYEFKNTLIEKNGLAPALNVLGTGSFVDESLPDLSCLERSAYSFTQNSGVQFDNTSANNFIGSSYTIEMYFKFIDNTGFMRIIDFKNRTTDFGLYATSTLLQFYDQLTVGTSAFVADQYVHLVVARDGTNNEFFIYINGVLVGLFVDDDGDALLDGSNVLNFFQDDLVFGGEARPGTIALLRLYDFTMFGNEVFDRYNNLAATSGVVAFTPDILSTCLTNNVFNFTNESGNSGTVTYSWEFGDGNGTTGIDATHSYTINGFFDVILIADDGVGCIDSATVSVEVYLAPAVTLGPDFDICDGDFAILDAGPGFASYLWNEGTTDPLLIVNLAGIYSVVVTDVNGCTGTAEIEIGILVPPIVDLGSDTTLCFGSSILLSAPAGNFSYQWSTGDITEDILVTAPGIYTVEVIDFDGCSAVDTVEIDFNPEVVVSLPATITECDSITVTLDPGPGFASYLWSDASTDSTLDVTTTGIYTVVVTDIFGCTASASSDVTFVPGVIVDLGADISICGGTLTTLDAGPGFNTYLWNDGSTGQTLDITAGGTYTVTVTDLTGCASSDEIIVDVDPFVTLGGDQIVCEGVTVTLDPGPGYSSYLWSDGSSGQTIDVTTTDIYTLTVTDINGCINSIEVEITFNAPPVVDLGTAINLCDGDVAVLDPGAGFSIYLWNDGSTGQTLNVTVNGTYTVTVTDIVGCIGSSDVIVTVVAPPIVDLGLDTDICDGSSYILDGGPGMAGYEWNDGSFAQTLLVSTAGTYTVTITDSIGCTATDDITIGVIAAPVVTLGADTTLCDGDQLILDAGAGFNDYLWNDNSILQTLVVTTAGIYTVTVTDAAGCTGTDEIEIDYYAPVPVPTISQNGNTLQSSSPTGNQWYEVPGGLIAGATGDTYEPGQDGVFYVVVTDANGCESDPSANYNFIFVGLADVNGFSFMIAPNPANEVVTITTGGIYHGDLVVELTDMLGRTIFTDIAQTGTAYRLELSGFEQGFYFVRLSNKNYSTTKRLIISR